MQSFCIFRNLNGCGNRCGNRVEKTKQYCYRHKGCENYIFELLNDCLSNVRDSFDSYDIYRLFVHIQMNDTYQVDNLDFNDSQRILNNKKSVKKEIFTLTLDYLFSKTKLKKIIHSSYYIINNRHIYKSSIIQVLYNICCNTFQISQMNVHNVCKIQRCFRRYFYSELTKYNNCLSENETDPFTYDDVNEIPFKERFGFKDSNNRIYIFRAVEFHHFLTTNGLWNPYTRDKIPSYINNRIKLMMIYHGLKENSNKFRWETPIHAYTEVSQLLEKVGFYNNVTWFNNLTFVKCCKIIQIYRDLCKDIPESRTFFPISFELTKEGYVFEFCKEVINMFEDSDNHYIVCCNFIKSLALNIEQFYNNLPSWLLDIESNLEIEFNATSDVESDGLFFFYVYNLMENLPEVN